MPVPRHHVRMFPTTPIALVTTSQVTRAALVGAHAGDPVQPQPRPPRPRLIKAVRRRAT